MCFTSTNFIRFKNGFVDFGASPMTNTFHELLLRSFQCMIWSWVLSLEIQFFIVACIVLLILKNHPRYGFVIFFAFFISSFIATTTLRFHDHHHSQNLNTRSRPAWLSSRYDNFTAFDFSLTQNEQLALYNGLHDQPWARLSPYFFGICMGYILHKTKEKLDINIVVMTCGKLLGQLQLLGQRFAFESTEL